MTQTIPLEPARFRLLLVPERAAWCAGTPSTLRFLVRVQAPPRTSADPPREPLAIALVLDRSGSMAGQPLEEARKCARMVVDRLEPSDRVAVYAFDDEIEPFAPLTSVSDRKSLLEAIDRIVEGGSTNLHGGWLTGAEALVDVEPKAGLRRVVLLSDGCANAGETDLEKISGQCRHFARYGVTTSTYGLGRGFNEELMLAMARAGRGNAYFGQTALDLADPFNEEFDLLASMCVRSPVLEVKAANARAIRIRNDYDALVPDLAAWRLPDLAFDAEAWAVVEVDMPAMQAGEALDPQVVVTVRAGAEHGAPLYLMTASTALPCADPATFAALPVDELFARRRDELDAAAVLADVRRLLLEGDLDGAKALLAQAHERFAGSAWVREILAEMEKSIGEREARLSAKEASFSRMKLSRRLASLNEPGSLDNDAVPSFLRRKPQQGKGDNAP